ncbi:ABC transporter ATP-binding protein [Mycoplasma buteonis]|uniref:ABC transporter ATP-binding protein n=1 Tax=Mycoplasma buteonis TaxID=171280 RepID=UPI000A02229F|nr:ABC transporter ATP-binding protein [Mycoplasma buteonis]
MENHETRQISKDITQKQKNNQKTSYFKTFKTLISYLKVDRKKLIIAFSFSLINTIFYIMGSFLIGMIVQKYFEPALSGDVSTTFDLNSFIAWTIILASSFILYGIFRYLENYIYVKVAFGAGERLRNDIIIKLHKMPISFYDKNKAGNLISSLIVDVNNVANSLFQMLTQIGSALFGISIAIILLFLISSLMTLIILPISLLMFGLVILLMKKSQPYFVRVQNAFGELNAFVEEMLANTKVTNSFDQQETVFKDLKQITRKIRNSAYGGDVIARSFDTWYGLISNLIIVMIAFLAAVFYTHKIPVWGLQGLGVNPDGTARPSLIILYISISWNYIGPFQSLLNTTFSLQIGIASSTRLFKLLQIQNPNTDNQVLEFAQGEIKGHVEFKNVYFKYNPDSKYHQLKGATFSATPGQVIAIVGPTGAGKTTIISLLTKYYDYESGSILIDGKELRNIKTQNLRDNMTIVLQDSFLFNETILDNLKHANPQATMAEVISAAKLTKAHHFIMNMPNGYETMVENNGANISQGQKQLLALTRAILQNKSILILDEATSNIDSATEVVVQNAMLHLMQNKTSFIIAHRLSTIKNADKIIVIDNGYIIEQGSHDELIEKQGFYYDLYTSQFGS